MIGEEERKRLEQLSIEEVEQIIRKNRPQLDPKTCRKYACTARWALKKDRFYSIASDKKAAEVGKELGFEKETIRTARRALHALEILRRKEGRRPKKYNLGDLIQADKKFPTTTELRLAIYEILQGGCNLTSGEIADRLGIPKIEGNHARRVYGCTYRAYNRLISILREGWIESKLNEEGRKTFAIRCHPYELAPLQMVKNPPPNSMDYNATLRKNEAICIPLPGFRREVSFEPKSAEIFIPTLNGAYLAFLKEIYPAQRYMRIRLEKYQGLLRWEVGTTRIIKIKFHERGLDSLLRLVEV